MRNDDILYGMRNDIVVYELPNDIIYARCVFILKHNALSIFYSYSQVHIR